MTRVSFAVLLMASMAVSVSAREWTDSTGKIKVQADYVGLQDGVVVLRTPDGRLSKVALTRLSEADQAFVKTQPALVTGRPAAETPAESVEEAVKDRFDMAVQQSPTDPGAYFNRGMARANKGETEAAIKDFNEAIRLKPKFAAAYDGRGLAYSKAGKPLQAHADFDRAIEMDPEMASAYRNRANNIEKLWDTPEGKSLLKERSASYRKKYEMARSSNISKTPWQPLNTTSGNVLATALNQMAQVDRDRAREIEAAYGGGGYGISVGGVGVAGPNVKIVGPGVTVTAPGTTVVGNAALAVYPEEVTQGQTITLVANPSEIQKGMPVQLDDNGRPIRRPRGAYGQGPPKEPVYAVDFYRDVDGDGLLNPDADQYLATDNSNKDGFTAEVSTANFPPGNQAYFAVGRGKQPAGVPATYEQAAEAIKKAAQNERDIAEASQAASEGGYTSEQAQELQELQERIAETTAKMAKAYAQTSPEAAKALAAASKPASNVDSILKRAERTPGEDSASGAKAAERQASEAADLLDKVAAMLAEKAGEEGEGSPSATAPASQASVASGKINPASPAPGKPGPGKGGYGDDKPGYGNDDDQVAYRDDKDDVRIRRRDDDDRDVVIYDDDDDRDIVIYDDDDDVVVRDTIDRALGFIDDDDYDGAIRVYDDHLVDNDDVTVVRERANLLVADGRYDYAVRDYDRLETGGYVMTADLYYNRGCAHLAAGRIEDAIEDFNKSIGLDETRNLAYTNRGTAFARKGEFGLAISDFNSALELNPRDTLAIRNRALAYKKLGKTAEAQADLILVRELTSSTSGE